MSDTDAQAPADDGGVLTLDQAVALRVARGKAPESEAETPAEPAGEGQDGAEEDNEDQPAGQTADDGEEAAETPAEDAETGEEDEAEPEEGEPIEPPNYLTPEDKVQFANLTRKGQELVLNYERQRAGMMRSAVDQATQARKQYEDAQKTTLEQFQRVQEMLPKAETLYTARWEGVDLLAISEAEGPEIAKAVKAQWEAEAAALTEMQEAAKKADEAWFSSFQASETPKLLHAIPELSDPAKAPRVIGRIKTLLDAEGYSPDEQRLASARDLKIAHKAALYDELMASRLSKPAPKPAERASRPVRPASAPPVSNNSQREIQRLESRLSQTHSIEDAVALRLARRKAG